MSQRILQVDTLAEIDERRPTFMTLGSFDGVHLGHQAIIWQMVSEARKEGARSAVLTFFPHPKRVLSGDRDPYYINTIADRLAILAGLGVDLVVSHTFDEALRHTRAVDFLDQLSDLMGMRQIWGANFAFGYKREGDLAFLQRKSQQQGFIVRAIETMVAFEGEPISSSRVRRGLRVGDFWDVNGCLGRRHSFSGKVVMGDQRGRTIGFPTANLALWEELLIPANGVYAAYAWLDDRRFTAAVNVGVRPTVSGRERTVEAYLLDFDDDIYGRQLRLEFDRRIRPEQRFASLHELRTQIQRDVDSVRHILETDPGS